VADKREEQVLLQVRNGATDVWTTEVLFDRSGVMYLANGCKSFCRMHQNLGQALPLIQLRRQVHAHRQRL
jgi:hypothetical protein